MRAHSANIPAFKTPWAGELGARLMGGLLEASKTEVGDIPQAQHFQMEHMEGSVVFPAEGGDVVFHLFPKGKNWPVGQAAQREFLAEAIDMHFGSTAGFAADHMADLSGWAIKGAALENRADYNTERHVEGFLRLLEAGIAELG